MLDVSIVIVNWNTRDLLQQCLRAIVETAGRIEYEIIVIDNGSTDGSVEMVRDCFPSVRLIVNSTDVGFARANNQAIQVSRGQHVLLLNSDTIVRPRALKALVRFMNMHLEVGIVGGQLLNGDGTLQPSWAKFPTVWSELMGKNIRARRIYPTRDGSLAYAVDWVGGACLLIRRAAFEQVGLLDEGFFMYSEEADWCFRVKQLGWAVCYCPEAQVVHLGGQSSQHARARMKAELYRSKLLFFYKHYGSGQALLLGLLLQCIFFLKATAGRMLWLISLKHATAGESLHQNSRALIRTISKALNEHRLGST